MHNKISSLAFVALGLLIAAPTAVQGQTAAQYNRAAQAIQICSSPAGALLTECQQLRGMVGGAANIPGALGGAYGGGVNAATAAGLLGMAAQAAAAARAASAAAPAPAPAPAPYGAAGFPFPGAAQYAAPAPFPAQTQYPRVDRNTQTALNIQAATAQYHACVASVGATNQAGVQGCIAQLQAASTPGMPQTGFPPGYAQAAPASAASSLGAAAINAFSSMMSGR